MSDLNKTTKIPSINLLEAFSTKPKKPDFIWPGMVAGTISSLIAPGGAGKTFAALEAAFAVAGGPDLLTLGVQSVGRVVYLALEDSADVLSNRVHHIGKFLSEEEKSLISKNLTLHSMVGLGCNIMDPAWLKRLEELTAGARLIVIDTLRRIHVLDENNAGEMSQLLNVLEGLCARTGAGILFLHHTNKNAISSSPDQGSGRGSTVLVDNIRGGSRSLSVMSEDQARQNNIRDDERRNFVQMVHQKTNYSEAAKNVWLSRVEGGVLVPASFMGNDPAPVMEIHAQIAAENIKKTGSRVSKPKLGQRPFRGRQNG